MKMGKKQRHLANFRAVERKRKQTSGEKRQVRSVLTCPRRGAIILPKRGLADRHHHRSRRYRDVARRTDARGALDMDRVQQAHRRKVYGQRLRRVHRKVNRRTKRRISHGYEFSCPCLLYAIQFDVREAVREPPISSQRGKERRQTTRGGGLKDGRLPIIKIKQK